MKAMKATEAESMQQPESSAGGVPTLPTAIKDAEVTKDQMRDLRHFYLGDPGAKGQIQAVDGEFLPALLNPFRDVSKVRYDYPLVLSPRVGDAATPLARPLSHFLRETVEGFAAGADAARILKDNLPWLERALRQQLQKQELPIEALPLLKEAAEGLQKHLHLVGENAERLQADLANLVEAVPADTQLLGYGKYVAIHLMIHAVRSHAIARRAEFRSKISELARDLRNLLEVEKEKSEDANKPESVKGSVGAGASYFDPTALSKVMKQHSRGSISMSATRRQRVENALKALEGFQDDPTLVRFVHLGKLSGGWLDTIADLSAVSDPEPCARSTAIFDEEAAKLAKVFAAARIAKLEIAGVYDEQIHDPWFANFNWEAFSQDELLLLPAVVALEAADRIAGEGMGSFSALLSSGRPVQVLVRVQAHNNPGARADEDPFARFRIELGYLGISHRQAVVSQTSTARFEHMLDRFVSALNATRTSLHLISTGVQTVESGATLDSWFVASAALEGRAHPFFHVNPEAGDEAAARVDFAGNPQPEHDWPLHNFRYQDENGAVVDDEIAFTFADYALLVPRLRGCFGVIPAECDSEALLPVARYLLLPQDQAQECLPFVWAVNGKGVLRRLIISRALVLACRDRLNFWRTLQEMAGVRSRYIELAVQKVRGEAEAAASAEIERIRAETAAEVERVRKETAGEVLGRLAETLIGMDLSNVTALPAAAPAKTAAAVPAKAAEPAPAAAAEAAPAAPVEEEEEVSFDDPWIESILCTSCNDCLNINPLMFVYNENKQAIIGDAKAGTFAQLVEAAEICPAKCIHPGKPLNPNEPDLDDLVARAARFN